MRYLRDLILTTIKFKLDVATSCDHAFAHYQQVTQKLAQEKETALDHAKRLEDYVNNYYLNFER